MHSAHFGSVVQVYVGAASSPGEELLFDFQEKDCTFDGWRLIWPA